MKKEETLPWKRPAPGKAKARKKLTAVQIEAARQRAQQAGRRYPNLVDNMWAARLQPEAWAAIPTGTRREDPLV